MLWPLAACLILTGIHVYLGVHVIARKVIFVDLALAQIAALGTVTGILMGYEVGHDPTPLYLYSLTFTIFGAFIFSITRMKGERVPHEAIIGIVYAVTFALTILVLARSPLGPQELDHIIKGELLWVQAPTVLKTAAIYLLVGAFHFVFRKRFMAISHDPIAAEESGVNVRLWDFLFYMSFGFVITSSVAIAGVFLVFSYLVIPSVGGMFLSEKLSHRLIIGWIGGAIISFIGVKLSWTTGLPTSPLIVCLFAVALILAGIYRYISTTPAKGIAVRNVFIALSAAGLFVAGIFFFQKHEEDPLDHYLHLLESRISAERTTAIANLSALPDRRELWMPAIRNSLRDEDAQVRAASIGAIVSSSDSQSLPLLMPLLRDPSDEIRRAAAGALISLGNTASAETLLSVARTEEDPELQISLLDAALSLGSSDAASELFKIVSSGSIFAEDAYHSLHDRIPIPIPMDETIELRQWWTAHAPDLRWNDSARRFEIRR